ncbi:MAG: acyltransferase family protein [Aminipila sp.]
MIAGLLKITQEMMMQNNQTIKFISVYRFIAMVTVLYYHLVQIPTYSNSVINVINGQLDSLILENSIIAVPGIIILNRLHMDTGSLAVTMFYIASGYLTSKMMERYTQKEYLINRVMSSFPTLWVGIAVIGIFVYFSQNIVFTGIDYFASMFPFWPMPRGIFVSAVLWTIRIEMKFYIIAFLFGKRRREMVFYGYMMIMLVTIAYYEFRTPWLYVQMLDLQFMAFVFLGVIIEITQRECKKYGNKLITACVILNILLFKISIYLFQDSSNRMSYPNCATQIIPVLLFILLMKLEKEKPQIYEVIPRFVYSSGKILLPLYITHVTCGITVMYQMHLAGFNKYLTLCGGVITTFAVAIILYYMVTKPSAKVMKQAIYRNRQKQFDNE